MFRKQLAAELFCMIMISCADTRNSNEHTKHDMAKTEQISHDLSSTVKPVVDASVMTGEKILPPNSEIFSALPGSIREIQLITNGGRYLAIRQPGQRLFVVYQEKNGHLVESLPSKLTNGVTRWLESLKIVKEIVGDEDDLGDLMEHPKEPFLLIRNSGVSVPQLFMIGRRTKDGDYHISLPNLGGRVFLVKGEIIDRLLASDSLGGNR